MEKEQYIEMTNLAFKYARKYDDKDFTGAYDDYINGFETAYNLYSANMKDLEMILNHCLNDAMCSVDRIKSPSSNNVSLFITKWLLNKKQ